MGRRDTLQIFRDYSGLPYQFLKDIAKSHQCWMFNGIIETIIDGMQEEIRNERFVWKSIWYTWRRENDKLRRIGIQNIKQQLYDYVAVIGLEELLRKKIGYYQFASLKNKGPLSGAKTVKKWISNRKMRYAWKGDARHYYENINIRKLKAILKRYVNNRLLLKLVFALIDTFEVGLSIGSYLSQYLANLYMSFAYHHATERLYKTRKRRDGLAVRVRLVMHVMIFMDDILFIATSLKDLKLAVKEFRSWCWDNLEIKIKSGDEYIDLRTGYIDMMGFIASRDKFIVRPRIFRRYRKAITTVKKTGKITKRQAKRIVSLSGWLTNAQCKHWRKRNKADEINKLCKEMISNGKNVVYLKNATSDSDSPPGRETGCNGANQRAGDRGAANNANSGKSRTASRRSSHRRSGGGARRTGSTRTRTAGTRSARTTNREYPLPV
ncbi:MAG: reverse transcriptase domain-containing protein [Eubacteriales bacterium]|nr:reverse transcriptase domain-containing protein [Eubacteriales bacterium]